MSREPPRALRGAALRDVLVRLGFEGPGTVVELPTAQPAAPASVGTSCPLVDLEPPPSTDPPRSLAGEALRNALDALTR